MSDIFKTKHNDTWVAIPSLKGTDGQSAGFDTPTATAYALPSGSNPTVTVTATGPDTEKQFAFNFGIPAGSGGTAQVQSDWNQTNTDAVDYIKNKPTIPVVPTNVSAFNNDAGYTTGSDVYSKAEIDAMAQNWEDIRNKTTSVSSSSTDIQYPSAKAVYDAIDAIPAQVQSDWSQTDTTKADYIKNKPNLSTKENVSNKVTSISSSSTNTQYPSAKAVYDAIESSSGAGDFKVIFPKDSDTSITITDIAIGECQTYCWHCSTSGIGNSLRINIPNGKYYVIHNIGQSYLMPEYKTISDGYFYLNNATSLYSKNAVISIIRRT